MMIKILIKKLKLAIMLGMLVIFSQNLHAQSIGVNTEDPHPSALMELDSDSKGFLLPRMNTSQRDNINSDSDGSGPASTLLIFNTDTECLEIYYDDGWQKIFCNDGTHLETDCGNVFYDSRDGNEYSTIKIGNQCWMAENLRYLPSVHGAGDILTTDNRYYVYGYNGTDVNIAKAQATYVAFGVLYNWTAANTACPTGWHLPTDEEWKELEVALGMTTAQADDTGDRGTHQGSQLAGNYNLWKDGDLRNNVAFGASGFNALPGGCMWFSDEQFHYNDRRLGSFWTATDSGGNAYYRDIYSDKSTVERDVESKGTGAAVRCVKSD